MKRTIVCVYVGGVVGVWLTQTWWGFTEWPWREIGAILWPLLFVAPHLTKGDRP